MQTLELKTRTLESSARRVAVCKEWDIPLGLGRSFDIGGRPIAVFKARDGRLFAVDGTCPHKGGPLADGMLAGDQVVCPYHAFRFHRETGECDRPGICSISAYPVEVEGDTICVALPMM